MATTTNIPTSGVKFDPLNLATLVKNVQTQQATSHKSAMKNLSAMSSLINSIAAPQIGSAPGMARTAPTGGYGGSVASIPVHASGNVNKWVNTALKVLGLGPEYKAGIEQMIQHESGGNPNAINRWDSNAQAGHPSQGLMQTIPGTFKEYALPGYNRNILDPVSNIIAGVRYARQNYGLGMLRAGGRHDSRGNYIGY